VQLAQAALYEKGVQIGKSDVGRSAAPSRSHFSTVQAAYRAWSFRKIMGETPMLKSSRESPAMIKSRMLFADADQTGL
jgi:hypothetical protein